MSETALKLAAMPLLYGAQRWHDRADEALIIADTLVTPEAREALLDIARAYRRLAVMAERRVAHNHMAGSVETDGSN
jgi:hypothetical protein